MPLKFLNKAQLLEDISFYISIRKSIWHCLESACLVAFEFEYIGEFVTVFEYVKGVNLGLRWG
jgi:hypothetical protein